MTMDYGKNYVITHLHLAYGSVGDSIILLDQLVDKLKELNMQTVCVTNHGSLADMYDFYYACIDNNIKPIIGCEVYLQPEEEGEEKTNTHLILLAKNMTGIKNLLKITSDASINNFYKVPRTTMEYLENHSEGLICTSACVGGIIPRLILCEDIEGAKRYINKFKSIFGEDFYLEIQPGEFQEQIDVNIELIYLSEEMNVPLVAANDVHYVNKEDWKTHDFHIRINRKMKAPENENESVYVDKIYYMMSYDELVRSFDSELYDRDVILKAIENTNVINSKCETVEFKADKLNLPKFKVPDKYNSEKEYLEDLCFKRLDEIKYKITNPSEYVSRIYTELDVIDKLGFNSYFLIMQDLVNNAQLDGIKTGPGRGSVCGSIVAYLIGITKIDSIKYNLLFDRFLSVYRTGSIPDVDLDCESGEGRDKLFKYTIDTYGIEKCAAVSTFGIRKARSAIRDVGRLYGIDLKEIDTIAKLIPQVYYIEGTEDKKTDLSIKESLEYIPELKEWQKKYPDLFDMAMKLENLPSHMSIHAAGTLIADTDIIDVAPMIRQVDKELNATSLDLHAAESQKLVKYDYLGLNTLNIISECEKLTGDIFDIEFDNYDDEEVWKLISSRNTTGLFQIGSNTYKSRMYKLKPNSIEELANCLALVRGPCISSKLDQKYINVLNGKEDIELIHPMYDSVVKNTCGIMIYQEQLMAVCSNMGLPLHEGYDLMKASAKKKFDKIKTYEEKLHSLVRGSMDDETFNYIFKLILDSGKYSFNKSHAIAYATICYITAYYKVHHIKEFIAATLTCNYNNKSGKTEEKKRKLYELYLDAVSNGVKFLPLDLKKSKWNFTVEGDKIRIGFCALAGFSKAALDEIYDKMPEASDEPLVKQIHDNVEKRICSKKAMIPLILSGAIGDPVENYEYYCELRKEEPQSDIKISKDLILQPYAPQAEVEEVLYRVAYTENKFNTLPRIDLDDIKINNNYTTEGYIQKVSKKKDSRGNEMAFIDVLTGDGLVSLVVFANVYKTYKSKLKKDNKIKFKAVKQKHTHKFIKATVM